MSTNLTVHQGIWTNWSHGSSKGKTLTLTSQDGTVLIAALALFVSIAASQSWGMLAFFVHQLRTTRKAQPGIHFQQQVTLRNHGSALATIWQLAKIGWAWRKEGVKSGRKSIGLVLMGLVYLLMFGAASVFSSRVATASDEVLVRSPNCGMWQLYANFGADDFAQMTLFNIHQRINADLSKDYVRDCLSGYQSSPECNIYKRRELPYLTNTNAACPFSPEMCRTSALQLDSGLLDSNDDLGINSEVRDRVQYRTVLTCAPITLDGFVKGGSSTIDGRAYNFTAAYYGENIQMNSTLDLYGGQANATYVHSDHRKLELGQEAMSGGPLFAIYTASALVGAPEMSFAPIPSLAATNDDAEVHLIFASFGGFMTAPSDDPWLSTHAAVAASLHDPGAAVRNITLYKMENDVSVLGCKEQHQLCNPNRAAGSPNSCTPLTAYGDIVNKQVEYISAVFNTPNQLAAVDSLLFASLAAKLHNLIPYFHAPLLASDYSQGYLSDPYPANQWQIESANWFATGLNIVQRYVAEMATGAPGAMGQYTYNQASNNTELEWFCKNYIMRNKSYTSFSVLALSLVFSIGGFAILASLWLETIIGIIQSRLNRGTFHRICWKLDSALQMQRMAFEEAGMGNWVRCADEVPLMEKGEEIKMPEEWDDSHPTIRGYPAPAQRTEGGGVLEKQGTMVSTASETTLAANLSKNPTVVTLALQKSTSLPRTLVEEQADVITPISPNSPIVGVFSTQHPLSRSPIVVEEPRFSNESVVRYQLRDDSQETSGLEPMVVNMTIDTSVSESTNATDDNNVCGPSK